MRRAMTLMFPLLLTAATPGARRVDARVPAGVVGTWEGRAEVRSPSLPPEGLLVHLAIAQDRSVTGKVGDATIRDGRFRENRGAIGRMLRLGTEYVIEGTLQGPLVTKDLLARQRVRMPVDIVGGEIRGDLNATGGGALISVRMLLRQTNGG